MIINYSTGAIGVPIEKRIEYLAELRPDVAALNIARLQRGLRLRGPLDNRLPDRLLGRCGRQWEQCGGKQQGYETKCRGAGPRHHDVFGHVCHACSV